MQGTSTNVLLHQRSSPSLKEASILEADQQRAGTTPPLLLCHEPTETQSPETNERLLSTEVHQDNIMLCCKQLEDQEGSEVASSLVTIFSASSEANGGPRIGVWHKACRQSPLSISIVGSERLPSRVRRERKKRRPLRKTSPDLRINMDDFRPGPLPPTDPTIDLYSNVAHYRQRQAGEDTRYHPLHSATTAEEGEGRTRRGMDQQPPSQESFFSRRRSLFNHYITPLTTRTRGEGEAVPGATVEERMVQQLRDLICQFDWAQVHMKHVQRKYFDKQYQAMERGWDALDAAIDEFHKQRSKENEKIAAIRSTLVEERRKLTVRNDAERVKRFEEEVGRLKTVDAQKSRLVAELRTKINSLEGIRKAFEESAEKNLKALKETQARLTRAETENSSLRVKLSLLKERSTASSSSANNSGSLNASAPSLPLVTSTPRAGRESPLFRVCTPGARAATVANSLSSGGAGGRSTNTSSGQKSVRWSSPLAAADGSSPPLPPPMTLHQLVGGVGGSWPTSPYSLVDSNMINTKYEVTRRGVEYTFTNGPQISLFTELHCHCTLYEYNNRDFRWIGRVGQRIQVYYYDAGEVYEISTPRGSKILFFLCGQLEVHWRVGDCIGDRTVITPGGKRIEVYQSKKREAGLQFEVFDQKRAYRWCENDETPQLFEPDLNRMSKRADNSFVSLVEANSLQIKAPDFVLRRLDSGFVRISFGEVCLQVSLCPCNVFVVKHVVEKSDGRKEKCVCYAHGSCAHINLSQSVASSTSLLSTSRGGRSN